MSAREKPVVHCWADRQDENGEHYTCMLLDGHSGPHEWTPDKNIHVTFTRTEAQR